MRVLLEVADKLDRWIAAENITLRRDGLPRLAPCRIRVVGQMALFEQHVPLHLVATQDVDATGDYEHAVERELVRLLRMEGKDLDPLAHEAWMPKDTQFRRLFTGSFVALDVAEPEAVLISKALKAPLKNRALITEYLAQGPSDRFLALAARYRLNLEEFL